MSQLPIDYSRKWYVLAAVAMGIFLATIDSSIVNVALPSLVKVFQTDFVVVQWVVLAYLLTLTSLLLSFGRLADMVGKKPIYLAGFVIFTIGSVFCAIAPGVYWLIAFRILQAIGATAILALGMAIVTEAFPPSERGRALGITGAVVSIGIIIGPALGGLILAFLPWHWIFLVNLPVGILGIWLVFRNVPYLQPPGGQRFDFIGAGLLLIGLLAFLFALTVGQQAGFQDRMVQVLGLMALIVFGLFLYYENRAPQPMIDLRIFRNLQFSINLTTGFITFIAIAGTTLLMPFYLENILGYDTKMVGILMAIVPIATGIVAPISGNLSDRFGSRTITIIGLAILMVGYYLLGKLSMSSSAQQYIMLFLPIGLGMGIFQSPNNSAIMGTASRDRLGIVSGMLAVTRTLGQTTGIAVVGALWASRVLALSSVTLSGGATSAPPTSQVAALQETFVALAILLSIALILAIYGFFAQQRLTSRSAVKTDLSSTREE